MSDLLRKKISFAYIAAAAAAAEAAAAAAADATAAWLFFTCVEGTGSGIFCTQMCSPIGTVNKKMLMRVKLPRCPLPFSKFASPMKKIACVQRPLSLLVKGVHACS